jgi:predicted RNA polymerase sigma factor
LKYDPFGIWSREQVLEQYGVTQQEGDERARSTAEDAARRSYGKLVAFLATRTHDVAAAEDALSEAFAAALVDWPRNGCPTNPEGWLMTVARRKLIDMVRRESRYPFADIELQSIEDLVTGPASGELPDERLAMMFACAHPAIDAGIRSPLILQVVLGLDAKAIASAFLTSPAAMGKRLVRAKDKIRQAGVPFRVPGREELPARLDTVLDAIYAGFGEGWSDPGGVDVVRRNLTEEALFLARLVVELMPAEPEALGLLALMLLADSRRRARRNDDGEFVPLAMQNPALWNRSQIREAEELLYRAAGIGSVGRFQLEAALQSAHADRSRTEVVNWAAVLELYDALFALTGSPVVRINRAVAVAELRGAEEALASMPELEADPRLAEYQPYWAARAELLVRTNENKEARHAYQIAIGLERDPAVRRFLEQRMNATEG